MPQGQGHARRQRAADGIPAPSYGQRAPWSVGDPVDVASFLASIHKQTLYHIIARRVRDPEILWLTRTILFHDPTRNEDVDARHAASLPRKPPQTSAQPADRLSELTTRA